MQRTYSIFLAESPDAHYYERGSQYYIHRQDLDYSGISWGSRTSHLCDYLDDLITIISSFVTILSSRIFKGLMQIPDFDYGLKYASFIRVERAACLQDIQLGC